MLIKRDSSKPDHGSKDEIKSKEFRALAIVDAAQVLKIFVDHFGFGVIDTIRPDCRNLPVFERAIAQLEAAEDQHVFSGSPHDVTQEWRDEVGALCWHLTNTALAQAQLLRRLEVYESTSRHLFRFLVREATLQFEPMSDLAKYMKVPPYSLSKWILGNSIPTEAVREHIVSRLIELVEASSRTLDDYNKILDSITHAVGMKRDYLEEAYANRIATSDRPNSQVLDFVTKSVFPT